VQNLAFVPGWTQNSRVKTFDRKFGLALWETIPESPGIYRFYAADDQLIYVGKAKNLRRRLLQYRNAGRRKRERRMRGIVKDGFRLEWEVKQSDLEACLEEVRWIQKHRPRWNIVTAFEFLYPLIGIYQSSGAICFCFTTVPQHFPQYQFHGAFRSREITGEAFFVLMQLLEFVGHRIPRKEMAKKELGGDLDREYSYIFGFRRLPEAWDNLWGQFFKGESPELLEALVLGLVENAGARAKPEEIQAGINLLRRFWRKEAKPLFAALQATEHLGYPLSQADRDLVFLRYRLRHQNEKDHEL